MVVWSSLRRMLKSLDSISRETYTRIDIQYSKHNTRTNLLTYRHLLRLSSQPTYQTTHRQT